MLVADGVAYLTFPSSSTIKMTSEVSWTRVRKYASLPWRITSSRRMIRSTARATWCARISSVAARSGEDALLAEYREHPDERIARRPVVERERA